jgi:hypothetical protein
MLNDSACHFQRAGLGWKKSERHHRLTQFIVH